MLQNTLRKKMTFLIHLPNGKGEGTQPYTLVVIGVSSPPFLGGHQSSALLKFNHKHYF